MASSHYLLHAHSLTLFEDSIYWTDRQLNRILSTHKYHGTNQSVVHHVVSQPLSIHVSHPSLQPVEKNPCDSIGCEGLCVISNSVEGWKCLCRPGWKSEGRKCVEEDGAYILLVKGGQILDLSLEEGGGRGGGFSTVVGVEGGRSLDYDRERGGETVISLEVVFFNEIFFLSELFYIEGSNISTISRFSLTHGNKTLLLDPIKDPGIIGTPHILAFDWIGRNLYIGNQEAGVIELVKVDGKGRWRMVVLGGGVEGEENGVEKGVGVVSGLCLDPGEGCVFIYFFWDGFQ